MVGDIALVEQELTLKIVEVDEIAIDDSYATDTGSYEAVRRDGSESAATDHRDRSRGERALTRFAERREPNLARIPVEEIGVGRSVVGSECHRGDDLKSRSNGPPSF
jgi:hypothetical protein